MTILSAHSLGEPDRCRARRDALPTTYAELFPAARHQPFNLRSKLFSAQTPVRASQRRRRAASAFRVAFVARWRRRGPKSIPQPDFSTRRSHAPRLLGRSQRQAGDYSTLYGPFTVHSYHEEWDSGTDIYATDAETGKDLMGYIVQCMRASGRYRGELFDTDDGGRDDSERLREMDEVEADYAGCLLRVECRVDGLEASAPTQAWHVLSRKHCEGPRRRYVRHRLLQV